MREATVIAPRVSAPNLERLRSLLARLDEPAAIGFFGLTDFDQILKSTISLCPQCLSHVAALVFTRGRRVFAKKTCETHGYSEALLENDLAYYQLSSKDRWGRRYSTGTVASWPTFEMETGRMDCQCSPAAEPFEDQWSNKSCTILVEITDACNLSCPVCYSDARGDRKLPLADFKAYIQRLIARKGPLDSVQLTGGEAVLHPEFWEMVAFLHGQAVKKIFLPTNGIAFADPGFAAKLAPFREKLMVLLQFDGQQAETNGTMRNANTSRVREKVIENLGELQVHMQLTMTITAGVNDCEIGWVVNTGLRHPHIKVVALQPVTYSGRYQLSQDAHERMTLSDCVKAVAAQVHRHTKPADFKPIPCSHPNCGWITLFVQRFGLTANIARHIDFQNTMGQVANRTLLNSNELRSVVGTGDGSLIKHLGAWAGRKLIRSTDVFAMTIKPFMDRFNYDLDRISACCHHLLDTAGRPVSFCEYNARVRAGDLWKSRPTVHHRG